MNTRCVRGLAFVAFLLSAQGVGIANEDAAFASAPAKAQTSSARLLAGEPPKDIGYTAGLQIELAPKTITYWRQPGDAGVAPVFDFSRSENVAAVEVLYPAPKHIEEAGSLVAGYDAKVTFPLRVTPRDPKEPVSLNLSLDYAACGRICLPARAKLSLLLPRAGASPYAPEIAEALAQTPRKIAPAQAKDLFSLSRRQDKPYSWRLTYHGQGKALDLFAEAPAPLFLDSARAADGDGFDLTLDTNGAARPSGPVTATLTIVTDKGAIEAPLLLE